MLLTLIENLNVTLFKYYQIMFGGVFQCLNICWWLQLFVSTLTTKMPRKEEMNSIFRKKVNTNLKFKLAKAISSSIANLKSEQAEKIFSLLKKELIYMMQYVP